MIPPCPGLCLVRRVCPSVAYAAMKTVDQWLEEYGESHQNPANKLLHWICVPVIVVSLVGLLWYLPVPQQLRAISPLLNWGTVLLIAAVVYYVAISWSRGSASSSGITTRAIGHRSSRTCSSC